MTDGPYTLLAMAPSGEAYVVKDGDDRIWLISIYAPSKQITASAVGGLVVHSGLAVVDRQFDTWDELIEYRRTAATSRGPRFPAYADYSSADVRAALRDTQTAEAPEEIAAARGMLLHILMQTKRLDHSLRAAVTQRLIELEALQRPSTAFAATLIPPLVIDDAMNRYELPAVA
ncbi:hypothetical protein [Mycobacteroides abscessus]|uniref:hypothetical protein n=1 Tax=Mycobacteroides abscessus TaxID=36809 RepID=UPI00177D980B|nr:hypothetical protein [Mycobacteroides abscessus]